MTRWRFSSACCRRFPRSRHLTHYRRTRPLPTLFNVFFDIDLGAGNDRAMVDIIPGSPEVAGKVRELLMTIDAGAGNDVVQDCEPMTLFTDAFFDFDLGAGNDTAMIEQYEGLTDPGQLQFTVVGGTGNDGVKFPDRSYL